MTNEEIVARIKSGNNQTEYMQALYEQNLSFLKKICAKYKSYCEMEDLLQESYFGLLEAVKHYDSYNEVKFTTYAYWWITQAVTRYIDKYGSCLYIPIDIKVQMRKYKKIIEEYQKNFGRTPTEKEISEMMNISIEKVRELECYSQPITSLDISVGEEEGFSTLCEFITGEENVENETADKIIDEETKIILMELIEKHMTEKEKHIVKEFYFNNKNISQIAEANGVSYQAIVEVKKNAIQKLRRCRKKLEERIEYTDSKLYKHNGVGRFNRTFSSTVEEAVIEHLEAQKKYQKWLESTSGKTAEQIKQFMDVLQMDFDRRMQYLYECE